MNWPTHHTEADRRRIRLLWGVALLLALAGAWFFAGVTVGRCGTQEAVSPPAGTGGWLDEGGR